MHLWPHIMLWYSLCLLGVPGVVSCAEVSTEPLPVTVSQKDYVQQSLCRSKQESLNNPKTWTIITMSRDCDTWLLDTRPCPIPVMISRKTWWIYRFSCLPGVQCPRNKHILNRHCTGNNNVAIWMSMKLWGIYIWIFNVKRCTQQSQNIFVH